MIAKFPGLSVADNAISIVRDAIKDIYTRAGKIYPEWVEITEVKGWDIQSQLYVPIVIHVHLGASFDDPNTRRVFIVINGQEILTSVFPSGHDTSETVSQLITSVDVPIKFIRIYDCGQLINENRVMMRCRPPESQRPPRWQPPLPCPSAAGCPLSLP